MLHMEIIQERLEREFDLDLITTLPRDVYKRQITASSAVHNRKREIHDQVIANLH